MSQATRTRDFHLEIPDGWVDRTMIAWSAPAVPGRPVTPNILVAYDVLQKGEDLAAYVSRQLQELIGKAKKFQLDLRRDVALASKPAIELLFRWDSGNGMLKQRQIYSLLLDGRVITLVNTALASDFDRFEAQFLAMVQSFGWNEPGRNGGS
jgi:hypothetical protein